MNAVIKIQEGLIIGYISKSDKSLVGYISKSDKSLVGNISKANKSLVGHARIPVGIENYIGEYTIRPKVEERIMSTRDKRMTKDLKIEAIPYYEVSNQNGKTIIIGGN